MTGFSASFLAEEDVKPYDETQRASEILGPRWANLPVITVCFLGASIPGSVQSSYAPPYLLSLGVTKSWMSMVFLAGPLSGLIVQPLIGILSDRSKSRFGRRRPYILGGTLLCTGAVFLLGFTRPFASIFTKLGTYANDVLTISLAVLSIYCINFAVNAMHAASRALLIDSLSVSGQSSGNAWAACMGGLGSIAGFFVGNIDLPHIFPFLGRNQLEVLCVIAATGLVATQMITTICVKEKVLMSSSNSGFRHELVAIVRHLVTLPRVIRQICVIQFFSAFAWFPAHFYSALYVGELYKKSHPLPPSASESDILALDAEATRYGSRALLYGSVVCLMSNIVLPFFVVETRAAGRVGVPRRRGWLERAGMQVHLATFWAISLALFALCMAATLFTSTVFGATVLMTVIGFCWAITIWAPSSLLGEAILTESSSDSIRLPVVRIHLPNENEDEERQFLVDYDPDAREDESLRSPSRSTSLDRDIEPRASVRYARLDQEHDLVISKNSMGGLSSNAGIILGIHNIAIVAPQFLVTGISSVVFATFDSASNGNHSEESNPIINGTSTGIETSEEEAATLKDRPNSIAILFRVGGVSALIAFVLCYRLARELKHR